MPSVTARKPRFRDYVISGTKRCACCQAKKRDGVYLIVPNDFAHKRWLCDSCITTSTSSIVQWNKSKGLIELVKDEEGVARWARVSPASPVRF